MPCFDVLAVTKKKEVMKETWGHLAPKVGILYNGIFIFVESNLSETTMIDYCAYDKKNKEEL